jgi:hypothetical protein
MSSHEMKLLDPIITGPSEIGDGVSRSPKRVNRSDEWSTENNVGYGIADCRKRLRTQRATLRTHHPPIETPTGAAGNSGFTSYAEIFATVSMNQSSLSRLVECLLDSGVSRSEMAEQYGEREEH